MDNRMIRRREALYTIAELSAITGIPTSRLRAMERSFLSDAQRAYMNAVGYCMGFYPKRKPKKGKNGASQQPDPQPVTTLSDHIRLVDE